MSVDPSHFSFPTIFAVKATKLSGDISRARYAIEDESRPPLREMPTGTSLLNLKAMDRRYREIEILPDFLVGLLRRS